MKRKDKGETATFNGAPYASVAPTKAIDVEYEIPPLRAIYAERIADDGQDDDRIRAMFRHRHPRGVIRRITRTEIQ